MGRDGTRLKIAHSHLYIMSIILTLSLYIVNILFIIFSLTKVNEIKPILLFYWMWTIICLVLQSMNNWLSPLALNYQPRGSWHFWIYETLAFYPSSNWLLSSLIHEFLDKRQHVAEAYLYLCHRTKLKSHCHLLDLIFQPAGPAVSAVAPIDSGVMLCSFPR